MFKAIDLFCGGGGLTEGLKQANFEVISAVENNISAAETFKANNKKCHLFQEDIRFISSQEIMDKVGIKSGELSLLAGCPPCQGFSSLTKNYNPKDKRNSLISEVSRLVKGLMPKAIMIENVPGLMTKGSDFLDNFINDLQSLGYKVDYKVLQVADYGVPQDRKRFVLLAGHGFTIKIPEATHSRDGRDGTLPWNTVKMAFEGLDAPVPHIEAVKNGGPRLFNWHVIRTLTPINIERLKHVKPGGPRYDIPDHLRPDCHKGKNKGYSNVYGRMDFNSVSPTITCGCTVLSKGRFGHPTELRTISVREAARLQTFPDHFDIATSFIDDACRIIGNALPCEFAKIMSNACYEALINKE
ncbi:DNA cytosine methyltransferase [Escherichia coli]|nr:DNA cytosine methyltransferase [Escherichia coli]EMC9632520.1 DNA cytosine methyltransferase [Escherichia coli]